MTWGIFFTNYQPRSSNLTTKSLTIGPNCCFDILLFFVLFWYLILLVIFGVEESTAKYHPKPKKTWKFKQILAKILTNFNQISWYKHVAPTHPLYNCRPYLFHCIRRMLMCVVSMDTDHVTTARCLIGRSISRDTSRLHTRMYHMYRRTCVYTMQCTRMYTYITSVALHRTAVCQLDSHSVI